MESELEFKYYLEIKYLLKETEQILDYVFLSSSENRCDQWLKLGPLSKP